jgi:hypothetical protein
VTAPDIDVVDRLLRDSVAELVEHLRSVPPNKRLSNRCTLRFGRKGGLAVDIDGPNKGRITDFNDGGNKALSPFQFIQSETGSDFAEALQWARAWLGIEGERPAPRVRRQDPESSSAEAEREEAERRAKVGQIIDEATDARGTPAEAYLRGRGITADLPAAVRWRPKAWDRYGALVLLATDAAGGIKAVQQVYVTAKGAKAPLKVQKRTNGSQAGAAVRLPGTAPLTLIEGPETGLSVWQSIGCETWVALGGIGKLVDQVPPGSEVIVARDADPEGSPADKGLRRAVEALVARGCRVRLACPPRYPELRKTDFNDVLQREGEAMIRATIAAAKIFEPALDSAIDDAIATPRRPIGLLDCAVYFPADRLDPETIGPELRQTIARFLDDAYLALQFKRDYDKACDAAKEMARSEASRQTSAILDEVIREVSDEDDEETFYRAAVRRVGLRIHRDTFADGIPDPAGRIEKALYRRMRWRFVREARTAV